MSLTLKSLFDRIAGSKGYLEPADLAKAAVDAKVQSTLMGFDVVARAVEKLWTRLDPEQKGRLSWDEFRAQGSALIPANVGDDPEAATKKAWELFGDADAAVCKDDRVTCEELREAVAPRLHLPFLLRGARGQIALISAQMTFAILGKNREGGAIDRDEFAELLDDIRANTVGR